MPPRYIRDYDILFFAAEYTDYYTPKIIMLRCYTAPETGVEGRFITPPRLPRATPPLRYASDKETYVIFRRWRAAADFHI